MNYMLNMIIIIGGFVVFHTITSVYGLITPLSFLISIGIVSILVILNGFHHLKTFEKQNDEVVN